jgi:hypothetical protein
MLYLVSVAEVYPSRNKGATHLKQLFLVLISCFHYLKLPPLTYHKCGTSAPLFVNALKHYYQEYKYIH